MPPHQLTPAEQSLVEAGLKGLQGASYPPEIANGTLSPESAYRIQLGIVERQIASGRELAGWKVAMLPPPMQAIMGAPVLTGPLFVDGLRESGSELSADTPGLVLEVEVVLRLAAELSGPEVTAAEARAAVATAAPCFEIIGGNFPRISPETLTGFVAVGVGNLGVVSGTACAPDELRVDELTSELWRDGAKLNLPSKDGNSPFQALADLANHLASFGQRLKADQYVISGARVIDNECSAGTYEGRISQLGSVNLTLR